MRTSTDALRSVARHMHHVLGPDWEVRLDDEMVNVPFCFVSQTTPVVHGGGRFAADLTMGVRAACYVGPKPTAEAAVVAAGEVEGLVFVGMRRGAGRGRALRIPLYDYDDTTLVEDVLELDREAHDFLRVTGLSVNQLPEPEDRRRVTVLVAFTVGWRRAGEVLPILVGPTTTAVTADWQDPDQPRVLGGARTAGVAGGTASVTGP